jgi:hypothetical protein
MLCAASSLSICTCLSRICACKSFMQAKTRENVCCDAYSRPSQGSAATATFGSMKIIAGSIFQARDGILPTLRPGLDVLQDRGDYRARRYLNGKIRIEHALRSGISAPFGEAARRASGGRQSFITLRASSLGHLPTDVRGVERADDRRSKRDSQARNFLMSVGDAICRYRGESPRTSFASILVQVDGILLFSSAARVHPIEVY